MFTHYLLTAMLLQSTVTANLLSSGVFLVRILSEQRLRVQYCFTELPYPMKDVDRKCLKSGQLEIIDRTETVLDLRITNLTAEYLTVEFEIAGNYGRTIRRLANRVAVDGALPAERIAIAKGIVMDFVTVCDRPFYGIMCARQCFEKHGANYICDPRGEKVCLVGWTGKDCDMAITDVPVGKSPDPSSTLSPTFTSTGRLSGEDIDTSTKLRTSGYEVAESTTPPPVIVERISSTKRSMPLEPIPTGHSASGDISTSTSAVIAISLVSLVNYVLAMFIVIVLVGVAGYTVVKMVRSPVMENLINRRRARVFAVNVPTVTAEDSPVKSSKAFLVHMEETTPKKLHEEQLTDSCCSPLPRCSKDKLSVKDCSLVAESSTYHEIDSFFVQPVAKDESGRTSLV